MLVRSPFFRKIQSVYEGERAASYGGIAIKSIWYWLLCGAGIALYILLPMPTEITVAQIACLVVGLVVAIVCPILTYFFPLTASVAGSLYSVVQGFILALISEEFAAEYGNMIWVAIGSTALIFLIMLLLYSTNIIKVNKKFTAVIFTVFIASIIMSAVVFISSFFTDVLTNLFLGNGAISIAVSVGALIISAISLVFEFNFIKTVVCNDAMKKYEWVAAYGLFMTVTILFIRIIELISKIMSKDNK